MDSLIVSAQKNDSEGLESPSSYGFDSLVDVEDIVDAFAVIHALFSADGATVFGFVDYLDSIARYSVYIYLPHESMT
jgi:hypothetical protein